MSADPDQLLDLIHEHRVRIAVLETRSEIMRSDFNAAAIALGLFIVFVLAVLVGIVA